MPIHVPHIVSESFAAERETDARELSPCFAEDGFGHVEGGFHLGREAIRRHKEEAGDFSGSPIELDLTFEFSCDKILSLDIHS